MAINENRYIQITSAELGSNYVANRRLNGLRMTENEMIPVGAMVKFNLTSATDFFKDGSNDLLFAQQFFSYVSNAPATKATEVLYAGYAPNGRDAKIFSDEVKTPLALIKKGNIKLVFSIGENETTLEVTGLEGATSYQGVAETINQQLTAINPDYKFSYTDNRYVISSTERVKVGFNFLASENEHLLGFDPVYTILSHGCEPTTPLVAFREAEKMTDNFATVSFSNQFTVDDLEEIKSLANYINGLNVKYQLWLSVDKETAPIFFTLEEIGSIGVVYNGTKNEFKEAIAQAIIAGVDYDRRNSTTTLMYKQGAVTADVTDDQTADYFDGFRVNYYGQTAKVGQNIAFFQRGELYGGVNDLTDAAIHANEIWLKDSVSTDLFNLLLGTNKIPANNDGIAQCNAVIMQTINRALFNGSIITNKEMTANQKEIIYQVTGDPNAHLSVFNNGYWLDGQMIRTVNNKNTEFVYKYTLIYLAGDAVRKIEGSHNIVR